MENTTTYDKKIVMFSATGSIGTDHCNLIEIVSKHEPHWKIVAVSTSIEISCMDQLDLPGVEIVQGDIMDLDFATQITNDADMVLSCVGFVQDEERFWAERWPTIVNNLLSITSIDRPLIFHDNLYENRNPKTPLQVSRRQLLMKTRSKAAIRSLLHGRIQERMKETPGSVVAVGGSNIFGPHLFDDKITHGVDWEDVEW